MAARLRQAVGRDNLYIKIHATTEALTATTQAIAAELHQNSPGSAGAAGALPAGDVL